MSTVEGAVQNQEAEEEKTETIDFKMVTFSLGGKDYGIDIMKVKDIAKDSDFTYVPNTAPYVRGVYNLRGEIISIIDLRVMFNVPVDHKPEKGVENIIILRLDEYILGVIVDKTDKIVGISSERIQPPHPLFGDINIKYISGVVEHDERLYIILDVERIFGQTEEEQVYISPSYGAKEAVPQQLEKKAAPDEKEPDFDFITETLGTFKNFHVSDINVDWIRSRFAEWKTIRSKEGADFQIKSHGEADEFLQTFYSPNTGQLLGEDYFTVLKAALPQIESAVIKVWNPGCGKGLEAYSLACFLKTLFPEKQVKIWANDNDLLSVSSAPSLVFSDSFVPSILKPFMTEVENGLQFSQEIKECIMFEYHDILHGNPYRDVDVIFSRDVLSFQKIDDQQRLITDFIENLKKGGILFLGRNETIPGNEWERTGEGKIIAFRKQNE